MSQKFFLAASILFPVAYSALLIYQPSVTLNVAVFLIGAVAFVGYSMQLQKKLHIAERQKELETVRRLDVEIQMQTLRLQLDPHFMYNVIAEIQHLVEKKDELTNHFISAFSRWQHRILVQRGAMFVSVYSEVSILKEYITLQELRNSGRLKCYVLLSPDPARISENDDYEDNDHEAEYWQQREIPTFVIQPFVDNAIRHGIQGLLDEHPRLGIITVHLYDEGDTMRCVIEDNGVGREESERRKIARSANRHLSIATSATQERLRLLRETFGINIEVSYEDLRDDDGVPSGTRVTVTLPCRHIPASLDV